jgi:hypothetical protein
MCQEELLKHSFIEIGIVGKFVQLIIGSFFILIIAMIIHGIWNSVGNFVDGMRNTDRRDI